MKTVWMAVKSLATYLLRSLMVHAQTIKWEYVERELHTDDGCIDEWVELSWVELSWVECRALILSTASNTGTLWGNVCTHEQKLTMKWNKPISQSVAAKECHEVKFSLLRTSSARVRLFSNEIYSMILSGTISANASSRHSLCFALLCTEHRPQILVCSWERTNESQT